MRYESPTTVEAAVTLLANEAGKAHILAGGTDLLVRLRSGFIEPDLIVDLKRIDALKSITMESDGLRVGAAVPSAMLNEHADAVAGWPGVCEAASL
ncbi:MAG TPA: oxidoreductase, partial [Rhodospirillaceae bacterium]|nr:oxidoreductase [Rhodospirillaceae bacterium]